MIHPARPRGLTCNRAPVILRFADVTQEGRLVLDALPNGIGPTVWDVEELEGGVLANLASQEILPILTRFHIEAFDGPISIHAPLEGEGCWRFVRTDDGKFALDAWLDLYGVIGRTHKRIEAVAHASRPIGQRVLVGQLYVEHVLTRPFAADPAQRRVTEVPTLEKDAPLPTRAALPAASTILELPEGAAWIEPAPSLDLQPAVFGLMHTDSNGHVNSLVYFRLFEEAALRRFHALGLGTAQLGRALEIGYRKPCFAGQTMRVVQRAFRLEARYGIASSLIEDSQSTNAQIINAAKPLSCARIIFDAETET